MESKVLFRKWGRKKARLLGCGPILIIACIFAAEEVLSPIAGKI
ncbi:hypothetical protein [Neobacillus sp. NPDC093127]